jgi:hypothetical protein
MLAIAVGVRLGNRPARWLARLVGYAVGIGAFLAYSKFATLFGGAADWWVAALWALEAVFSGFMLHRLGWDGDEK